MVLRASMSWVRIGRFPRAGTRDRFGVVACLLESSERCRRSAMPAHRGSQYGRERGVRQEQRSPGALGPWCRTGRISTAGHAESAPSCSAGFRQSRPFRKVASTDGIVDDVNAGAAGEPLYFRDPVLFGVVDDCVAGAQLGVRDPPSAAVPYRWRSRARPASPPSRPAGVLRRHCAAWISATWPALSGKVGVRQAVRGQCTGALRSRGVVESRLRQGCGTSIFASTDAYSA